VVVDPTGWDGYSRPRPVPPLLDAVQKAVVDGEQITLAYVARTREPSTRVVHPLGLAAKGTTWYMIADSEAGLRTFRVDRMTSVEPTGDPVVRPDGFDLEEAWRLISDEVEQRRTPFHARAWATPETLHVCRWVLGNRVRIGPTGSDGRVEVELRGHNVHSLAGEIAGVGAGLEVVEPVELRERLAEIASELVELYR
jgi:predicted DNA-binding transcriptional regulator YafY